MLKIEYLQQLLIISVALSTITCTFIQKTKKYFKSSKYLVPYSLIVNITFGIIFSITFTNIKFPNSIWLGMFSFLGADALYRTLEGKILSYTDIMKKKEKEEKEKTITDEDNSNKK